MWDEVLNKANAAWLIVAGVLAGVIKLLVNARSQVSDLSAKLAKDRSAETILATETTIQVGWLKGMVEQNERDRATIREQAKKIEDLGETRINDARMIERRDAELVACRERVQEMKVERDIAHTDMIETKKQLAAVQEHVIVVDGQMLSYRIANAQLFSELPDDKRTKMINLLLQQEQKP